MWRFIQREHCHGNQTTASLLSCAPASLLEAAHVSQRAVKRRAREGGQRSSRDGQTEGATDNTEERRARAWSSDSEKSESS